MMSKMIRGETYTKYTAASEIGGMRRTNATNTNAATSEMPQMRKYFGSVERSIERESNIGVMSET